MAEVNENLQQNERLQQVHMQLRAVSDMCFFAEHQSPEDSAGEYLSQALNVARDVLLNSVDDFEETNQGDITDSTRRTRTMLARAVIEPACEQVLEILHVAHLVGEQAIARESIDLLLTIVYRMHRNEFGTPEIPAEEFRLHVVSTSLLREIARGIVPFGTEVALEILNTPFEFVEGVPNEHTLYAHRPRNLIVFHYVEELITGFRGNERGRIGEELAADIYDIVLRLYGFDTVASAGRLNEDPKRTRIYVEPVRWQAVAILARVDLLTQISGAYAVEKVDVAKLETLADGVRRMFFGYDEWPSDSENGEAITRGFIMAGQAIALAERGEIQLCLEWLEAIRRYCPTADIGFDRGGVVYHYLAYFQEVFIRRLISEDHKIGRKDSLPLPLSTISLDATGMIDLTRTGYQLHTRKAQADLSRIPVLPQLIVARSEGSFDDRVAVMTEDVLTGVNVDGIIDLASALLLSAHYDKSLLLTLSPRAIDFYVRKVAHSKKVALRDIHLYIDLIEKGALGLGDGMTEDGSGVASMRAIFRAFDLIMDHEYVRGNVLVHSTIATRRHRLLLRMIHTLVKLGHAEAMEAFFGFGETRLQTRQQQYYKRFVDRAKIARASGGDGGPDSGDITGVVPQYNEPASLEDLGID